MDQNLFNALPASFELSVNYLFITGLLIVIFGFAISILPPKFRIKTNSIWLVYTFALFGLARIISAADLFEHANWHSAAYIIIRLFSVLFALEFIRHGLNTNYQKKISPFIHISVAILFSIFLSLSPNYSLIFLEAVYYSIKAITLIVFGSYIKKLYNPQKKYTVLFYSSTFACITIQAFFHFYLGMPELFEKTQNETIIKYLIITEYSLISILVITMLAIRYRFTTKNLLGKANFFKPAAPAVLCICALITGLFGLRSCYNSYNQNIQSISSMTEKASNSLSKTINEKIEFVTTSASIMSHIPCIVSYFQTNEQRQLEKAKEFLNSFNDSNPNTLCMLIDTKGNLKISSHDFDLLSKYNYSSKDFFKQAIQGKANVILEKGMFTQITGFFGTCPIKNNKTQEIIGVAMVKRNINVDGEDIFKEYAPALLINNSGNIIISSPQRLIGTNIIVSEKAQVTARITNEMLYKLPGFNHNFIYSLETLNGKIWKILLLREYGDYHNQYPHILITSIIVFVFMIIMFGIVRNNEFIYNYEAAQKQFKLLFDYAPDSVFIVSAKTNTITAANNQMEMLFSMPAGLVGTNYSDIFANKSNFNGISDSGVGIFRQECNFKKFNGEVFVGEITSSKVKFDDEDSWMIILHDISEHKELEYQLSMTDKIKTCFYANASHEIRTPITAIIGLTELALAGNISNKETKIATLIKNSAKSLLNIVDDMLDISRIESGEFSLNYKPFKIKNLVNETCEFIRYSSEGKNRELNLSINKNVPETIVSDPSRTQQILTNIINYAIKITEADKPIKISVNNLPNNTIENGFNLELSVTGDFNNISQNGKTKLFETFIYDNPYTKKSSQTSGISLSVTKQIIECLKGSIAFTKTSDNLTSFSVSIPVFTVQNDYQNDTDIEVNNIRFIKDGKPMNFLVADDNEINTFIASSIIKKYGGNVFEAHDGNDAINIIESNSETPFSCLLIDIQMPILDGLETIKRIRNSHKSFSDVPIIAISAFASEHEGKISREIGANDYLSKPYYPNDLINIICKNINGNAINVVSTKKEQNVAITLKQIDIEDLKVRLLQNPKDIEKINEIYSRRYDELSEKIKKCENSNDAKLIIETAHSIKGLVAMLSAKEAANNALEAETLAKNNDLTNARAKLPILLTALEEIYSDLKLIINEIKLT